MTAILTATEMRALERAAMESGAVTGLELMERAGRGVVEAILAEWPGIEKGERRAVVLCGPGNNGGDGFVVARLLKEEGWRVEVFLLGRAEALPPDARTNHDRWAELGPVRNLDDLTLAWFTRSGAEEGVNLWIDAIFGIGLSRPVGGEIAALFVRIRQANASLFEGEPGRMVAVDVPSGLDSDTGLIRFEKEVALGSSADPADTDEVGSSVFHQVDLADPLAADLTVTFHSLKPGHLLADGPFACGRIVVVDIGLDADEASAMIEATAAPNPAAMAKRVGHKYGYGHAVILSGGCGHGGAARLAARGALRIGAGLVTLVVPPAALQENAARIDAIMLRSIRDPDALTEYLADARLNALCVGPGFGTGEKHAAMLAALLDASAPRDTAKGRSIVLDADALTLVAREDALRGKLHPACVLTPHEGEFARLFPAIDAEWRATVTTGPAYSKVDAARAAAKEAGCVVLLKGPDTVIADPSGRVAINAAAYDRAAPWLATAGSGDVLAGFIAGLLARGFAPFDAACTAAWLHVDCARSFGPCLIAEDLPEELPKVFRALGT